MRITVIQKLSLVFILMILVNIILFPTTNYADVDALRAEIQTMESPLENPDEFKPTGQTGNSSATIIMTAIVVKWIRNIGVIVGVVVLTLIGTKYMLAAGTDEKAQYKETLVPLVIGVIMLMGSISLIITIAGIFD